MRRFNDLIENDEPKRAGDLLRVLVHHHGYGVPAAVSGHSIETTRSSAVSGSRTSISCPKPSNKARMCTTVPTAYDVGAVVVDDGARRRRRSFERAFGKHACRRVRIYEGGQDDGVGRTTT